MSQLPKDFYLKKINFYEQLLVNINNSPHLDDLSRAELISYFSYRLHDCYYNAGLDMRYYNKPLKIKGL